MKLKEIYNSMYELSKLYHAYFKNFSKTEREEKGIFIAKLIQELMCNISDAYFCIPELRLLEIKNIHSKIHQLDFLIRDLYKCKIINIKQKTNLNTYIGNILENTRNYEE